MSPVLLGDDPHADHQTDSWNGSAIAGGDGPVPLVEVNSCSYISAARVTKPISEVAEERQAHHRRFRLSDLVHRPPALCERRHGLLRC